MGLLVLLNLKMALNKLEEQLHLWWWWLLAMGLVQEECKLEEYMLELELGLALAQMELRL